MVEIDAILITDVNGIGTTADDQLAFVSLIADQGETTTVAFGPEIGSRIAASFMAACGQLQHQIATRTGGRRKESSSPLLQPDSASELVWPPMAPIRECYQFQP
ncbi:hypothetical protein [Sinorhizobium fredii]|uniref:hypothetical protein n=1 Tax=Rhizobium fredii TaxID=380 RepID=UPI001F0AC9CB|nr:hypothetical protein [Sinorhizobium fredii]